METITDVNGVRVDVADVSGVVETLELWIVVEVEDWTKAVVEVIIGVEENDCVVEEAKMVDELCSGVVEITVELSIVVDVVVGGGGTTITFLDIDFLKGYKLGYLLSA